MGAQLSPPPLPPYKHTGNPLLIPRRAYLSPFEGGGDLIETGGLFERGGIFNLETMMVSVLHKELEYKVEKLKYEIEVLGHAAENQNQIQTSQLVNKPSRISPHEVLQS